MSNEKKTKELPELSKYKEEMDGHFHMQIQE